MLQKDGKFRARKEGFDMVSNVPIRILTIQGSQVQFINVYCC